MILPDALDGGFGVVLFYPAGSASVAAYQTSPGGRLTFLRTTSVGTGAAPLDNAVSSDAHALYVLNRAGNDLVEFSVGRDAQLTAVGTQARAQSSCRYP